MLKRIVNSLMCLSCQGDLSFYDKDIKCVKCGRIYKIKNGAVVFHEENTKDQSDSFIFGLKIFLKKHPKLFFFLFYMLGVFTGKTSKKAIEHVPRGSLIVNVASGIKVIREDVINVDLHPFLGIHIAADAQKLPLKNSSCDAVICEASLEHIKNPVPAVQEMYRVLKNGGLIYIIVPFIQGFHSSPSDYYRWTKEGVKELFKNFEEKELGIFGGPTYAFTSVLREWLAIILSFNSEFAYQIFSLVFLVILAPFNFLDYVFSRYKSADNMASSFYFIGTKKSKINR
ncbi:MAG: hypothetical protein A2931_04230 [Candidatus Niyogibacteria bacterium RIFCSPLOWO2_01_FULL_45_48]|uniref:Methyltransferase type 11 domain-containing protein n=2 Tax=Candidatus Niyogiibacteriota TaxID=1817912 RepID=A0A1G2F036_9BACT|nr:MAG: hypothetical protein A2931_04230 [Candidatus Niyogibacteria bacterium RIFCSPLOWO2_01_FULL_45_48]OGZ31405.1 MAG: hypothetical protein A3J00_02140 [Candidatus Niyogibacteria bacterium RIFCSPLOWO2_02_FULL_45_13]